MTANHPLPISRLAQQSISVNPNEIFVFGIRKSKKLGRRSVPIELDELCKRLGKSASKVWGVLVGLRNKRGIAHPTRAGLSRMLGISVASVAKALRRLKALGMIEHLGKILCTDTNPYSNRKYVWAHAWRVAGKVAHSYSSIIRIPMRCRDLVKAACCWGGKRRGAGRVKNSRVSAYTKVNSLLTHPLRGSSMRRVKDARNITSRSPYMAQNKIGGSGKHVPGWWTWLEQNGVPPFPGRSVVQSAVVPHPPKLTAKHVDDNIRVLGEVYRAAVYRKYKTKSWVLVRGEIRNSKHYDSLCEAVALFTEHGISPAAWAEWHMNKWKEWKGGKTPPPISATYDPAKIQKWRGWFAKSSKSNGGKAIISESHRHLLHKYRAMRRDIRRVGTGVVLGDILKIVDKHFPDGLYEILVQKSKVEAEAMQFKMEDSIRKGKWIW